MKVWTGCREIIGSTLVCSYQQGMLLSLDLKERGKGGKLWNSETECVVWRRLSDRSWVLGLWEAGGLAGTGSLSLLPPAAKCLPLLNSNGSQREREPFEVVLTDQLPGI